MQLCCIILLNRTMAILRIELTLFMEVLYFDTAFDFDCNLLYLRHRFYNYDDR